MPISYVASAVNATTVAATSLTVNVPTGVANGDLLLWVLGGQATSIVLPASPPAGWLSWNANLTVGANNGAVFWYRYASSEPGSYASGTLTSGRYASYMTAYRGVDPRTPKDATNTTATSGTGFAIPPAITPVSKGAWPVMLEAGNIGNGSAAPVWASSNATALVAQSTSTVASVANPALIEGYLSSWVSGAFTFNLSTSAGTFNAGHVCVSVLKAARTGNFLMFA